ncbi:MAG: hypothetical protein ABIG71_01230 [Candidatus Uhrbacteria bacterium]
MKDGVSDDCSTYVCGVRDLRPVSIAQFVLIISTSMKYQRTGIVAVAAVIAVLISMGIAYAQEPQATAEKQGRTRPCLGQDTPLGALGGGIIEDRAAMLGMSADELRTEIEGGKTFHELITEQGLTPEEIHLRMTERLRTRLSGLVTEEKLTQEKMDAILEQQAHRFTERQGVDGLEHPFMRGTRDMHGMRRGGGWKLRAGADEATE